MLYVFIFFLKIRDFECFHGMNYFPFHLYSCLTTQLYNWFRICYTNMCALLSGLGSIFPSKASLWHPFHSRCVITPIILFHFKKQNKFHLALNFDLFHNEAKLDQKKKKTSESCFHSIMGKWGLQVASHEPKSWPTSCKINLMRMRPGKRWLQIAF